MYKHVRVQSFSVSKIDYHTILNNPFISQNITPVVLITIGEFFIDILACGGVKRQSIRGFHLPHSTSVVKPFFPKRSNPRLLIFETYLFIGGKRVITEQKAFCRFKLVNIYSTSNVYYKTLVEHACRC